MTLFGEREENWRHNFRNWQLSEDGSHYIVTRDEPEIGLKKGDLARVVCNGHGNFDVKGLKIV